jgi:hypothetical protein
VNTGSDADRAADLIESESPDSESFLRAWRSLSSALANKTEDEWRKSLSIFDQYQQCVSH